MFYWTYPCSMDLCVSDRFPFPVVKLSSCNRLQGLKYLLSSWCITEEVGPPLALHMTNSCSKATLNRSISLEWQPENISRHLSCFPSFLFLAFFFSKINFLDFFFTCLSHSIIQTPKSKILHSLGHISLVAFHFISVSLKMWLLNWTYFIICDLNSQKKSDGVPCIGYSTF